MKKRHLTKSSNSSSFFDSVSVGLAEIDINSGKFVRVNAAFCKISGYTDVELVNEMTFLDITLEEDRSLNIENHRRLITRAIDSYRIEKRYRRKNGTVVYVRVWVAFKQDHDGENDGIAAVITDITHEQRLEERLRLAQQVGQIGTWEWDITSDNATCSKSYYGLYGLSPDTKPPSYNEWLLCVHPDDRAKAEASVQNALAGHSYSDEFRVVWPNGTVRWLSARGILEREANGSAIRLIGANIDITTQKQREEDLNNLRREASHRMSNSLALISSSLRLQRRKSSGEATILDSVARRIGAVSYIHQRLEYSSLQGEVDIDEYITEISNDISLAFFNSDRRTFTITATSHLRLSHDRAVSVGLIATELVLNALKYAHDKDQRGNIFVEFSSDGQSFCLIVGDDGVGLKPDFVPEVSKGMGMEIIQSQVQRIGGRLEIDRAPPGVRFIIRAAI